MKLATTNLALAAAMLAAFFATESTAHGQLGTRRVAEGFTLPLYATSAPGETDRLFVLEQHIGTTGRIQVLDLTDNTRSTFLEVPNVTTGGEQGLLGLAFDPDYATNGRFYVNYTTTGGGSAGQTIIERYNVSADPDLADATSGVQILSYDQPASNHNAGWMGFSPVDGYLYISSGDGGGAPADRAQELTHPLGKILRIDVSNGTPGIPATNPFVGQTGAAEEIWSYGLRNPWRPSFDSQTGDLWIADVGSNDWEEINFQPASSDGGENYGWPRLEGDEVRDPPAPGDHVLPLYQYDWSPGGAVTGGYVYRGDQIPELEGAYLFGDFGSGQIWSLRMDGTVPVVEELTGDLAPDMGTIDNISSFGQDADGNLYIVDYDGEVFRIVPEPSVLAMLGLGCLAALHRRRRSRTTG